MVYVSTIDWNFDIWNEMEAGNYDYTEPPEDAELSIEEIATAAGESEEEVANNIDDYFEIICEILKDRYGYDVNSACVEVIE